MAKKKKGDTVQILMNVFIKGENGLIISFKNNTQAADGNLKSQSAVLKESIAMSASQPSAHTVSFVCSELCVT